MSEIARWTTPSVMFKPSAVPTGQIDKINMYIKLGDNILIQKDKDAATVSDEWFSWPLSQEETSQLERNRTYHIKIDYLTLAGMRYTTSSRCFEVSDSGGNEVMT